MDALARGGGAPTAQVKRFILRERLGAAARNRLFRPVTNQSK
ncbi:hypothetical protein [Ramlibacter lithotrophicus]|nr:hypothetical protein [Ramlibacter lithotrophicus]